MTPQEVENDHENLELLRSRLIERLRTIEDEHIKLSNEANGIQNLLERITPTHGTPVGQQCASSTPEVLRGPDRAEKNSCVPTKAITRSW